jgi:O-antigen ligase
MLLSELYKIKYLVLLELSLLTVFAQYGLIPVIGLLSIIVLFPLIFYTFKLPIIAVHILIFSILIDAIIPYKNVSKGPTLFIEEIFLGLFLTIFTIKFLLNLDNNLKIPLIILIWIPFFVWTLPIGLFVAVEKLRILVFWKNYFAGFFSLILVYYAIENKIHLKSLILGLIIWGFILALIEFNILMQLGGFSSGVVGLYFKKNLFSVSWGRSNYLAAFFVVIIPLTFGYLFYTKSLKLKLFFSAGLAFMFLAIILTLSRGGLIALVLALMLLFAGTLKARSLIPFISVLLIVVVIILLNPLTYVIAQGMSSLETAGSVYSRLNFYEDTWKAFLNYPLTGVGFGNLSYYATFILGKDVSTSAHNIILGMLGETGLIGGIFFFSILGVLIVKMFKNYRSEEDHSLKLLKWAFFSAILGGCLHSLIEPNFEGFQFSIIFWAIVGTFFNLNLLKTHQDTELKTCSEK